MEQKKQVEIECHLCKHKWNYKGKSLYWVTCPACLSKIKSPAMKAREEAKEE